MARIDGGSPPPTLRKDPTSDALGRHVLEDARNGNKVIFSSPARSKKKTNIWN
jgi:hypothetical protein